MRHTIAANLVGAVVGFSLVLGYTIRYEYTLAFGFFMTFFWGIQDGGINCLINCILGFQFDSKTAPFSVNKFAQSLLIFAVICFESVLESKNDYLFYFIFELAFCILSWLSFNFFFEFKKTGEQQTNYDKIPSTASNPTTDSMAQEI